MVEVINKREPSPVFPFLCVYGKHTGLMLKTTSDSNFIVLSSTDDNMRPFTMLDNVYMSCVTRLGRGSRFTFTQE